MNELIRAFDKFIMRDLSFIAGGGAIILSFLYVFDKLPQNSDQYPTILYAMGIALAYVVGYVIQDTLGLLRLVRMKAGHAPCYFQRVLYRLYDRANIIIDNSNNKPKFCCLFPAEADNNEDYDKKDYDDGKKWQYTEAPQRFRNDHTRIEGLKQVGFTVGPCLIISSIIIFIGKKVFLTIGPFVIQVFISGSYKLTCFEILLTVFLFIVGLLLYILGWLKVTQQTMYTIRVWKKFTEKEIGEVEREKT